MPAATIVLRGGQAPHFQSTTPQGIEGGSGGGGAGSTGDGREGEGEGGAGEGSGGAGGAGGDGERAAHIRRQILKLDKEVTCAMSALASVECALRELK